MFRWLAFTTYHVRHNNTSCAVNSYFREVFGSVRSLKSGAPLDFEPKWTLARPPTTSSASLTDDTDRQVSSETDGQELLPGRQNESPVAASEGSDVAHCGCSTIVCHVVATSSKGDATPNATSNATLSEVPASTTASDRASLDDFPTSLLEVILVHCDAWTVCSAALVSSSFCKVGVHMGGAGYIGVIRCNKV